MRVTVARVWYAEPIGREEVAFRLLEPDAVLRRKIVEFVERSDFGLASNTKNGGAYVAARLVAL
jgi:hypothetical protein